MIIWQESTQLGITYCKYLYLYRKCKIYNKHPNIKGTTLLGFRSNWKSGFKFHCNFNFLQAFYSTYLIDKTKSFWYSSGDTNLGTTRIAKSGTGKFVIRFLMINQLGLKIQRSNLSSYCKEKLWISSIFPFPGWTINWQ